MKNKIVTLSNSLEYVVLEELLYKGNLYIICSLYNSVDESIKEDEFIIVKVITTGDKIEFLDVESQDSEVLSKLFLDKLNDNKKY